MNLKYFSYTLLILLSGHVKSTVSEKEKGKQIKEREPVKGTNKDRKTTCGMEKVKKKVGRKMRRGRRQVE